MFWRFISWSWCGGTEGHCGPPGCEHRCGSRQLRSIQRWALTTAVPSSGKHLQHRKTENVTNMLDDHLIFNCNIKTLASMFPTPWLATTGSLGVELQLGPFCVCAQPMRDDVTTVTSSLIGWTHAQSDPCSSWEREGFSRSWSHTARNYVYIFSAKLLSKCQ